MSFIRSTKYNWNFTVYRSLKYLEDDMCTPSTRNVLLEYFLTDLRDKFLDMKTNKWKIKDFYTNI